MMAFRLSTSLLLIATVTGCSLQPHSHYQRPAANIPAVWQSGPESAATASASWWQVFTDPVLDSWMTQVLARNGSLAISALKVQQAQWQAGLARADQLPSLNATLISSASRVVDRSSAIEHRHAATLSVTYEADLWGKLARAHDAAALEVRATEQDWQATRLSLTGTMARLYWQAAYLDERMRLATDSVAWSEKTLQLVQSQRRAGAADRADELSARQKVDSQRAALLALQQQRIENRHALALLLDQPPESALPATAAVLPVAVPAPAADAPAAVLARRPDLQAAEWRLRKVLAERDVTVASYYPAFSLTGSVGSSSTTLGQVLANPVATLGSELVLPFLHVEQARLDRLIADNRYQQAVTGFRQSLYNALAEVENALSAVEHDRAQGEQLQQSLSAAREIERIAETRYRNGASALKDWLDAQETRRQAEIALCQNRYDSLLDRVALALALGG